MEETKKIQEIPCPECGAKPMQPCKDVSGKDIEEFHPERWPQKKIFDRKEDVNQTAARILREATGD